MTELKHLPNFYDSYGYFNYALHFSQRYNALSSEVYLTVPIERDKKQFQEAIALLDLATHDLQLCMQASRVTPGKSSEERPYERQRYFVSSSVPLTLKLDASGPSLDATFYYDAQQEGLHEWCVAQQRVLAEAFGKPTQPKFHVLTSGPGGFDTEGIQIEPIDLALSTHYNDDLVPVDKDIRESLDNTTSSGLILLHGQPGTGKTSYIKHLIAEYAETKFIFVPNDMVTRLLQPEFVSFMVSQRKSVLVIEDAEKVIQSREQTGSSSVVSTILQLTDGMFSDYLSIKVICTFNTDVSRIDPALFRKGRLIGLYKFTPLAPTKTAALIETLEKEALPTAKALTLAEIYNLDKRSYDGNSGKRIGFGS